MPDQSRRRALRAVGTAIALGAAGCVGGDGSGDATPGTDTAPTPGTDETTTDAPRTPPTSTTAGNDGNGTTTDGDGDRPTVTERQPRSLDVGGSWPQAGSDPTRDGSVDTTGVPGNGSVYWQLRRVRSGSPVLSDCRLFHYATVGADTDGRPTVTRTRDPDAGTAHPVYGRPALVARDAADGAVEWIAAIPAERRSWPAVAGDRVVGAVQGRVTAREVTSGDRLWDVDLGEKDPGVPALADGTAVVPVDGVVDGDGYVQRPAVRAVALADGAERWSVEPPHRSNGVGVAGGTVVVLSGQFGDYGTLLGLSLSDGTERWRERVPGGFFDLPVVTDDTVYVTNGGNGLRALSVADGTERWSTRLGDEPGTVAVDAGTVYAAAGGRVLALDAAGGDRRWQVSPAGDSEYATAVAVGADAVYAGFEGVEAGVYALAREDGAVRWSHSFPNKVIEGDMVRSGVTAQPVVAGGAVYVPAVDGLYAFGPA